ncbi:MAG: hypothetical protein F7B17_00680 [Desulfurococcales archaeon]|nr:hypothetical protein [Desulfurococcales archaeon]
MGGNLDYMKRRILELIDDSDDPWLKAAFYGDPKVASILNKLLSEWERNERKGIPLDYAGPDDLETLYSLASKYASMSTVELQVIALHRMEGGGEKEAGVGEGITGKIIRFLRRLIRL